MQAYEAIPVLLHILALALYKCIAFSDMYHLFYQWFVRGMFHTYTIGYCINVTHTAHS